MDVDELQAENERLKTALRSEVARRHGIDEETAAQFIALSEPERIEADCATLARRLKQGQEEQSGKEGGSALAAHLRDRYRIPGKAQR